MPESSRRFRWSVSVNLHSTCPFYSEHSGWLLQAADGPVSPICRPSLTAWHNLWLAMNSEGIIRWERIFGVPSPTAKAIRCQCPIWEQHVKEELGRIPTAQDWLSQIKPARWMYGHA